MCMFVTLRLQPWHGRLQLWESSSSVVSVAMGMPAWGMGHACAEGGTDRVDSTSSNKKLGVEGV